MKYVAVIREYVVLETSWSLSLTLKRMWHVKLRQRNLSLAATLPCQTLIHNFQGLPCNSTAHFSGKDFTKLHLATRQETVLYVWRECWWATVGRMNGLLLFPFSCENEFTTCHFSCPCEEQICWLKKKKLSEAKSTLAVELGKSDFKSPVYYPGFHLKMT